MKKLFGQFVRRIDIFGVETTMMLGGKFKYRSTSSGIVSLGIFLFFASYFWVTFVQLIQQ